MNGYCNRYENHCPMDNRLCGRREEARRFGPERDPLDAGERRYYRPPFDEEGSPFGGEDRHFGGDEHRFDRPPIGGEGPRRRHRAEEDFDHGPEHRGPRRHSGEGFRHGPERHGGEGPHQHPDFHDGRGTHGGPPRPDQDLLRQRLEQADLSELLRLCARLQPQGHGGPARGQALILSILAGRERISQQELQQLLGIRPGSVSEIVTKLERKGCLTRDKGDDRRGNMLSITDAGRAAIPHDADDGDDPYAVLSDEQRTQLADLLKTLLNHWIDRMD